MMGGVTHSLGEYLFVGPCSSPVSSKLLETFVSVCSEFGVPLASKKKLFFKLVTLST